MKYLNLKAVRKEVFTKTENKKARKCHISLYKRVQYTSAHYYILLRFINHDDW